VETSSLILLKPAPMQSVCYLWFFAKSPFLPLIGSPFLLFCTFYNLFTESQNHRMVGVGRELWRLSPLSFFLFLRVYLTEREQQ